MKKLSRELLAEKILKRRKDFGLTQAQVSEQTGINRLMIVLISFNLKISYNS